MADERNRLTGRVRRYARVGAGVGGFAARYAGSRIIGRSRDRSRDAEDLKLALGGLKGPIMKVAQMLATVPEMVPEEFAAKLAELQTQAPAMGWHFVRRRMAAELGPDWLSKFASFEREAAAAASLGQVHEAVHKDGRALAVKLQYPDMQSAVEADLNQLALVFAVYRRMDGSIDPTEILAEIGDRLREELDYHLESRHMALYGRIYRGLDSLHVPEAVPELSTGRLLTMTWLEGRPLLDYKNAAIEVRNFLAETMFKAWWLPFSQYAVIHGDPHLGNYTVFGEAEPEGINLLDFGCIRKFPVTFVKGVVDLYQALKNDDRALAVHAYETWGFENLSSDLIDALNIWARFIYGPMLEDRTRTVADGVAPGAYGRREAYQVHMRLKELGPITPPREFVFMDRAAIGLGAVFLHLAAEVNFYRMFNEAIDGFDLVHLGERQAQEMAAVGLPPVADRPLEGAARSG